MEKGEGMISKRKKKSGDGQRGPAKEGSGAIRRNFGKEARKFLAHQRQQELGEEGAIF